MPQEFLFSRGMRPSDLHINKQAERKLFLLRYGVSLFVGVEAGGARN